MPPKYRCHIQSYVPFRHICFTCPKQIPIFVWLVDLRTDTKRACVQKRLDYVVKICYSLTRLDLIVNIIGGTYMIFKEER